MLLLFAFAGLFNASAAAEPGAAGAAVGLVPSQVTSAPIIQPVSVDPLAPLLKATLDAARAGHGDRTLVELEPFYADRGFAPVWTGERTRLDRARQILLKLGESDREGLGSDAYEVDRLSGLMGSITRINAAPLAIEQAEFEFRMSRALVRYAHDVSTGRAGPEHEQDGGIRNASLQPATALLAAAATASDVIVWMDLLPPRHPQYAGLRSALATWRSKLNDVRLVSVTTDRKLEEGVVGPDVALLRQRLIQEGLLAPSEPPEQPSSRFDHGLAGKVMQFQQRYGLFPDGVVGDQTLRALNASVEDRVDQIRANMERWRWMRPDLGARYVFVNLASFKLAVVDHGQTIHTSRVIIGAPATPTPSMTHDISYVVINPYWNVPRSIMVKEMLPQIRRDPSWLFKDRLRLFTGRGEERVEVNPYAVNWSEVTAGNWNFQIRQDAGPGNSLGIVKFMFPNPDDIYLHDTPAKRLFKRSGRALSHGCIRVEDPLALAEVLLSGQGWTRQRMDQVVEAGLPERIVRLEQRVPIHLAYLTASVVDDGQVQFLDDVYGRDRMLAQALQASNGS